MAQYSSEIDVWLHYLSWPCQQLPLSPSKIRKENVVPIVQVVAVKQRYPKVVIGCDRAVCASIRPGASHMETLEKVGVRFGG
jgi:hypothetical protein